MVSRILGVVRDILIAAVFGASFQADAFFLAFRPFDLLRKLFADGILSISFVPVFSRLLAKNDIDQVRSMLMSAVLWLALISGGLILAGRFLAPFLFFWLEEMLTGPSWGVSSELFKIMLGYTGMVLFVALSMGILNSFGHFSVPAATPVVLNLVLIFFTVVSRFFFGADIRLLALGVTVGGLIQLGLQIPFLSGCRMGGTSGESVWSVFKGLNDIVSKKQWVHPGVKRTGKDLVPAMIGAAAYQINILVASFFASGLGEGRVSALYFADRLVQFPLALFSVSVSSVLLPLLSRQAVSGRRKEAAETFADAVRLVLFVTVPAMFGMTALCEPVVRLLFGQGAFDSSAVHQTALTLLSLLPGLWAFAGMRLFVTLHYAVATPKIPFYAGLIGVGMNLLSCLVCMTVFGGKGLGLGVSLSSMAGFAFLCCHPPKGIKIPLTGIWVCACRSLILSVIMYGCVVFAAGRLGLFLPGIHGRLWLGGGIIFCILLGIVIVFAGGTLISAGEMKILKQIAGKKRAR